MCVGVGVGSYGSSIQSLSRHVSYLLLLSRGRMGVLLKELVLRKGLSHNTTVSRDLNYRSVFKCKRAFTTPKNRNFKTPGYIDSAHHNLLIYL